MHIGICGPIDIPSLNINFEGNSGSFPVGMGGSPVNHIINAMLEAGHQVSVFTLSPEIKQSQPFEWQHKNLAIYMGPYRKRARQRCLDFFKTERNYITKSILRVQPEVIHAHWQYEWAWGALSSKIPTLVTCHDAPFRILQVQTDLYRLIRLFMAIVVLRKAKNLTAVSPYTSRGINHITSKKIKIVPNFEPEKTFNYYNPDRHFNEKIRIAMINNGFYGLKNVAKGIEAFSEFRKTHPSAELHLYGINNGMNEDAYNWCIKNNLCEGIFFKGSKPFDKLMQELSNSYILLHTSIEESCPMVLIEAMAMGIAIIAGKNSGGVPWMLEDGGGLLVDITSVENIVSALRKISTPENLLYYSREGREVAVKRFSKKVVLNTYLDELKKLRK